MKIRILTFNTFLRPYVIKTNENDWKQERMLEMLTKFQDYDIICLQEMFDTFSHRQYEFVSLLQQSGFQYVSISDSPNFCEGKLIDGGLVLASKYPIIESEFLNFGNMGQSDGLSKKGVLYCRIQIDTEDNLSEDKLINSQNKSAVYFNLFLTHTQASYPELTKKKITGTFFIQFDQVLQMRKFVEEIYFKRMYLFIFFEF